MSAARPVIGITMGDPAGIGAEVVVKALADPEIRALGQFVIFGLNELLAYTADLAEIEAFWWRDQHERFTPGAGGAKYNQDVIVLDYDDIGILGLELHGASKSGGAASMQFCCDAIKAAQTGLIDAMVTGPICKESWKLAGFDRWPGHTELLAEKTKAKRYAMMFAAPPPAAVSGQLSVVSGQTEKLSTQHSALSTRHGLRVVLCTIHEALFELRNSFKIGTVFDPIDLAHQALVHWFGIEKPRIAVCGLNPHASENGQFGDEEKRIIEPAIMMARQHGIDATGPFAADTIFIKALQGQYDLVVAMYHDQGLIPVKLVDFAGSVNMTLGLPIVRTSPDHGTAFDIVGKNKADASSMKAAIRMAAEVVRRRGLGE